MACGSDRGCRRGRMPHLDSFLLGMRLLGFHAEYWLPLMLSRARTRLANQPAKDVESWTGLKQNGTGWSRCILVIFIAVVLTNRTPKAWQVGVMPLPSPTDRMWVEVVEAALDLQTVDSVIIQSPGSSGSSCPISEVTRKGWKCLTQFGLSCSSSTL